MRFYLAGVEINYTFARSFVVDINQESERRMNYFFKITMKKVLLSLTFMALAMTMMAIPAKRGVTKMLTLADGTTVKAQLVGDEHGHYWKAEDGKAYTQMAESDLYQVVEATQIIEKANARRVQVNARRSQRIGSRRVSIGEQTHYTGKKKGLVILMQFKDTKFKTANNLAKYKKILNEENYSEGNFKGSVADYFKAQSGGVFELNFDVVGPYTAAQNYSYYGKDDGGEGNDQHADELIVEAVKAAHNDAEADLNFRDYDWDNDGEVDQVFILYAGKGQADGGAANTIWPHMYYLAATGQAQTIDDVVVNTYACSNEIMPDGSIEGIGCFCHEFSHCMGFPDFYDTSYSGWFGMGDWDLMCSGSYNGDTFRPAGYTAYEKYMSGWLEPLELTEDVKVENLKPTSDGGDAYILYNSGHRDEYYMIENRQLKGWDASLPGSGLMITHVDFDKTIWEENNPNTKVTQQTVNEYAQEGYTIHKNDHQRCTLIRANNKSDDYSYTSDVYPYNKLDSVTATSKPAASLYNKNAAGTKYMEKGITKIKKNTDGTMSFVYGNVSGGDDPIVGPENPVEGDFYESFDQSDGKGGNDNQWSGQIAQGTFTTDNEGWSAGGDKSYGANRCAKFGTSPQGNNAVAGSATTPAIALNGTATLTFKAGAWDGKGDGTTLSLSVTGGTTDKKSVTLTKGSFGDYEATVTGTGTVKITFAIDKGRFFLDEVKLKSNTTAIKTVEAAVATHRIYTLDGRYVGKDFNALGRGLYIVDGKKVVK